MNRREFFAGLSASVAIAITPAIADTVVAAAPVADWHKWYDQWQKDALDVFIQCWEDQICYGVSAYERTDIYPFVRRIDPLTLPAPATTGGLLA